MEYSKIEWKEVGDYPRISWYGVCIKQHTSEVPLFIIERLDRFKVKLTINGTGLSQEFDNIDLAKNMADRAFGAFLLHSLENKLVRKV